MPSAGKHDIKKKVLLDLFASPLTVLPLAGGLTAWLVSWGVGGSEVLTLLGLAGVLGGLGMLATRWIFGFEKIVEDAHDYLSKQQRQRQEDSLDALDKRLRRDKDPRTHTCLRELRHLYQTFREDVNKREVSSSARVMLENVDKLFEAAVKHLEHSYHLWETARDMSGRAKQSLLDEREKVGAEELQTVDHLGRTIQQFHKFRFKENESELAKLRDELDETMRVARRAEERLAALGKEKSYDRADFE